MRFRLNEEQLEALEPFVKDQSILDLGADDLEGSELMLEMGARDVLAVDRHQMPTPSSSKITTRVTYFHNLQEVRPVVLASWIVNWQVNITEHLAAAKTVISISKNTDASACGYTGMWEHLRRRELLLHLPARQSTLTVYGPRFVERGPTGEEFAALHPQRMYSFDEAELEAQKSPDREIEAS
jgi:hypothetical protein